MFVSHNSAQCSPQIGIFASVKNMEGAAWHCWQPLVCFLSHFFRFNASHFLHYEALAHKSFTIRPFADTVIGFCVWAFFAGAVELDADLLHGFVSSGSYVMVRDTHHRTAARKLSCRPPRTSSSRYSACVFEKPQVKLTGNLVLFLFIVSPSLLA